MQPLAHQPFLLVNKGNYPIDTESELKGIVKALTCQSVKEAFRKKVAQELEKVLAECTTL